MTTILKKAISDSGLSIRELGRRSGVSYASISLFMAGKQGITGKRGLTLDSASKIADTLNLELVPKGKRGSK